MRKIFNNIPIFMAICTIEKSKTKKEAKHNAVRKLLELLHKEYLFSEQTEPVNELKKSIENDF